MNTYNFYKEHTKRWYIDLPDYTGSKADLEMVSGADTMLDLIADGKKKTSLTISEEPFEGSSQLDLIKLCPIEQGGGDYILKVYNGEEINHKMWICEVAHYVFGKIPQVIYFKN